MSEDDAKLPIVEGIGEEVILTLTMITALAVVIGGYWSSRRSGPDTVHPDHMEAVASVRQRLREQLAANTGEQRPRPSVSTDEDRQCPVCLNEAEYAVQTNCGHTFCGSCMVAYFHHGSLLGPVRCPVCRQQVTIILTYLSERELSSTEEAEISRRRELLTEIRTYNRRFSGEPRSWQEYLTDLPTLLRHLWNEFFSMGGLVYMFRIRILMILVGALLYFISPLDILPEAVFGILGFLDDAFVFVLLAIYVSIIYRRYITDRDD